MSLKFCLLAFMLLLVMLFLGVVSSEDASVNLNLNLPTTTENAMSTLPIEAPPSVYDPGNVSIEKPNLFIGGIDQSPNPDDNTNYEDFAKQNGAYYVPTFYGGAQIRIISDVSNGLEVDNAAKDIKTYQNGLKDDALNGKTYGTIIAYSGGTTSVVTAMAEQNVKADTLILISPMKGWLPDVGVLATGYPQTRPEDQFDWQGEFAKKIQKILASGTKIIVIQSSDDTPPVGSQYQYKFPTDTSSAITVYNVNLEKRGGNSITQGINGHIDIFSIYAMNHITNGGYVAPGTDQNATVNSLLMGSQQGSQANTQENAANTYCSDHGGYIQEGACTFLDGSSCNAQDFLNGKCSHESQQYQQHNLAENCSNEGNDLLSHGKYNEAINAYEKAVEINPHYYPAWVDMGNALDEIGKHDEAVQAYNEAIEINPHCDAAWENKGRVLYNQGKYNEAIECFDEETKIDPQDVIAWYFESLSLRELHRDTDADAAFAKAKELGYQPQPAVQLGDQQSYQPPESQSNGNDVADEEAARKQAMAVANDFQSEFGGTLDANKIQKLNQIFK